MSYLSTRKPDCDVLKSFPFTEGLSPAHYEKQKKIFSPMMKKNKYGRITLFFFSPSDCPVGIKIPPPGYRIQAFKMHKDRIELLLSP